MSDPLLFRFCYFLYFFFVSLVMIAIAFAITTYLTETFIDYNVVVDNWKSDVML